ncbi:MAG: peptidoglycan DD-metalloendopeptidase family protein [Clostridiales Family XIII bacterium]|jgi:murein DD-endopeptidase MepM/ murein hydrolase activator NlpD|nr:peptidoglycan DD-metalloendopeptidase family protein [Clostridiales Family XIII bacterium]
MTRRTTAIAATVVLLFSLSSLSLALATDREDLDAVREEISRTQAKYDEGKKKESALSQQIKDLEARIQASEAEIAGIQGDINETQAAIASVELDLAAAEERVSEQGDALNARLRAMYMNGEMGLIDIILGSSDISEFMSSFEMVKRIYESDLRLLEDMESQYASIDAQKKELESMRRRLVEQQTAQKNVQSGIEADRNAVALAKVEVSEENKKLSKMLDELNEEANRITAEILRKQGSQAYIEGDMLWPVPEYSRISSEFGNRMHPILKVKKMHTGLDIAAPSGTPIRAANGGTVIVAGWNSGGYGNMVMVDHGGKIVTLYAHCSSLAVSEGDIVAAGQTIAYVGSTGNSTGPHCHFEVRVNGDYQNPRNWVSP